MAFVPRSDKYGETGTLASASMSNVLVQEPAADLSRGFPFLLEPEPWLRVFARNFGDLFRPAPPQIWITSPPAEYWADAQVNRPAPWSTIRLSFAGHILFALAVYALTLIWLDQPQVVREEIPRTTITNYQLSEYLPAVNPQNKPEIPVRKHAQKADPEYAPQEIVSLHVEHNSLEQTIVQPKPDLLYQDQRVPNLMVSSAIPGAPLASRHPTVNLPMENPVVVPPAQPTAERRLTFPLLPQPQVIAPPTPVAQPNLAAQALPVIGPTVIPPAQTAIARNKALEIPAQSPQVAAPAPEIADRKSIAQNLPLAAPEVVPPAQQVASRSIPNMGLAAQPVVPPPQPASTTLDPASQQLGQLLVLNARAVPPAGPIVVPEGNRRGEFLANMEGHPGASARPEIKEGDQPAAGSNASSGTTPANVYVSAPPVKIASGTVVAAPPGSAARLVTPDRPSPDRIENQIFGTRGHYSMRMSMPNLNSSAGSWTVHFAVLKSAAPGGDISAPEPVSTVDPAYPAALRQDHIEGVVVLYAVIRADGSVAEVRVLEGFDKRLDENARSALERWSFRPGTRNGVPVDMEAVIRVPFRVPRPAF